MKSWEMHSSTFTSLLKMGMIFLDDTDTSTFAGRRIVLNDRMPEEPVLKALVDIILEKNKSK
jgi:hypothetical protein